jgi:hypothetical protein
MGLLINKKVKDVNKRHLLNIIVDIVLIIVFIAVALHCKGEFDSGYKFGRESCLFGYNNTTNVPFVPVDTNVKNIPNVTEINISLDKVKLYAET